VVIDDLRKLRNQEPFTAFRIWTTDGVTNYLIADARDLILTQGGTIALRDERDELQILNHIQVARVGLERPPQASRSPRKASLAWKVVTCGPPG
jgi:hypothetical protein